jgi:hypothetical protein
LHKRKVEFSNKEVFSPFPINSPFRVFDEKYWWSDAWDPMDYGREYDFSRSFFEQFCELQLAVPMPHRRVLSGIHSDYSENAVSIKNCYLCFNAGFTEDSLYSESINRCKECVDTLKVEECELSYELFNCQKCFRTLFSSHCLECVDLAFSIDLVGCQNCFGCVSLRNKKYYIFNQPYSREEYFERIREYNLGSARVVSELQKKVAELALRMPVKFFRGQHNVSVRGDYLDRCKNTKDSFYCCDLENCSYCQLILFAKSSDCMDISVAGGQLCYELQEAGGYEAKFSWVCIPSNTLELAGFVSLQYCMYCFGASSSNLFGCIGLRNKQYCILNKQYSKEEYEELVPKIIDHMNKMPYVVEKRDEKGEMKKIEYRYGEFFPSEFSPLPYNETWAQDYYPLTKEKAEANGFLWNEVAQSSYQSTKNSETLPDDIKEIDDSILEDIIQCAQCSSAFKIIPQELQFYRRMNLPLPKLCFNCRHRERAKGRNPLKLWHRQCMCDYNVFKNSANHPHHKEGRCPNEFETSYAPDRPEIVYCESCYQSEVI